MGQHEADPKLLRCKLFGHKMKTVNKVLFADTPKGFVHHIQRCQRDGCQEYGGKTVRIK